VGTTDRLWKGIRSNTLLHILCKCSGVPIRNLFTSLY
jgi:hypothetical protein